MHAARVLEVVGLLRRAGIGFWIGGGWGVDALIGLQTREHDDLDIAFDAEQEASLMTVVTAAGFRMAHDQRPVKFVVVDVNGNRLDAHPARFDADGVGWQENFDGELPFRYPPDELVEGTIDGERVPCLALPLQLRFHTGYDPRQVDLMDLRSLRDAFGRNVTRET